MPKILGWKKISYGERNVWEHEDSPQMITVEFIEHPTSRWHAELSVESPTSTLYEDLGKFEIKSDALDAARTWMRAHPNGRNENEN